MAYNNDPSYPPPSHFQEGNRPFRQGSSANSSQHSIDEQPGTMPYVNYASTPSLPRYDSSRGSATNLANPSPLNPAATRSSATGYSPNPPNVNNRYSTFGHNGQIPPPHQQQGSHPLANAMYMESSPTLAGSEVMSPSEEKMRDEKVRLGAADQLGEYIAPSTSSGNSSQNSAPFRRGPKPTGLRALYRLWSGANLADSGKDERHVKLPRLGYLDGLKFISAWVVLNGTFFGATLNDSDYSAIQRNSPLYIVRSTGLGICFLLILLGRSLITPLWDVPAPNAVGAAKPNASKPNTALISWARLTRAMLVRPFRFILPVLAIVALQWGLGANGQTSNCNNVGMDEPYWGLIGRFAGYCTLVFDLFTTYEYDTLAGQTFAGNLWTNAWFFQSSYAVYCTHMMLGNLSSNRYWVYGLICFFSWTTYNYFFVAILGLVIADMHAHGHLHTIRTKWPAYLRLSLHGVLIAIALVFQWVPVIRDNVNYGMGVINVTGHPEITFCDAIFVACWLFCIETSGLAQNVFGNIVMRTLGKLAPGMYLLAPAITYSIVPDIALNMHNNGSSASSVLGSTWIAMFAIVVALSIAFHFLVELPSKMIGEVVCEWLENWDGEGGIRSKRGKLTKNAGPQKKCPSRGSCTSRTRRRYSQAVIALSTVLNVVAAALSKQNLIDYLGGSATGQTLTTVAYSLTVLSNETDVLVSCEIDEKMSEVGWLGFGVGSTMSDADIVILWPNSDSSWTLSHRRATTTAMPLLLGDVVTPPQKDSTSLLSIVDSLSSSSSSDSPTIVTFSRPLNPSVDGYTTAANFELKREINQGVIFAKGDEDPGSEKQDSDLKQHSLDSMGGSYIDLSIEFEADSRAIDAPLTPVKGESSTLPIGGGGGSSNSNSSSESTSEASSAPTGKSDSGDTSKSSNGDGSKSAATATGSSSTVGSTSTNSGSSTGGPSTSSSISADGGALSYANVIKIHAICAASAWLFFAPLGVLYARFGRGPPGTTLFRQTWITAPLTFGAVGLAYYATTLKASTTKSGHQTLGFTFAALLLLQIFLGWWTHESHELLKPGEPPPARALKAWLHILIGISLIGLGFVQVRLGMIKYGATDKIYQLGYWA
ncbi:hypothetical protein JCM3765_007872 [Sporobolomyces pararoseus]